MLPDNSMIGAGTAILSTDGAYRYYLDRIVSDEGDSVCVFIMLNPSTADAKIDDPTIRRCMRFTKDWGYHKLVVVNLFAYRATSPETMKSVSDPVGPDNFKYIMEACKDMNVEKVIAAWGNHGNHMLQSSRVTAMLQEHGVFPQCLGKTKKGEPKHPLYIKADTKPFLYGH